MIESKKKYPENILELLGPSTDDKYCSAVRSMYGDALHRTAPEMVSYLRAWSPAFTEPEALRAIEDVITLLSDSCSAPKATEPVKEKFVVIRTAPGQEALRPKVSIPASHAKLLLQFLGMLGESLCAASCNDFRLETSNPELTNTEILELVESMKDFDIDHNGDSKKGKITSENMMDFQWVGMLEQAIEDELKKEER